MNKNRIYATVEECLSFQEAAINAGDFRGAIIAGHGAGQELIDMARIQGRGKTQAQALRDVREALKDKNGVRLARRICREFVMQWMRA